MSRTNTGTALAAWTADYCGVRYERARYAIYASDGHACLCCGATAEEATLSLDHVVCDVRGGTDEPRNLVTLCVRCNSRRRDLTVPAFAAWLVERGELDDVGAADFRRRVRNAQRRHTNIARAFARRSS